MAADDEPFNNSQRYTIPIVGAWTRLRLVWMRVIQGAWLGRLLTHVAFLLAALAGLLVCKALVAHDYTPPALASLPQRAATVEDVPLPPGGTGGEMADVLLSAVVPHTTIPKRYRIDPITYTVQTGDNVSTIAEQFGVSVATVLWNNGNLEDNPDYLSLGDILTILPVSGVYHTVADGDTLESIAEQYKANVEDIIACEGNYLTEPYTIAKGQKLIVPGGSKPYQVRHVVAWSGEIPAGAERGSGVFGWPMSGYITQRYHEFHPAVDIAAPEGTPIKAADSGYVAVVGRSDYGYGRYVLIDHGNGFQTLYGHFSVIFVEVGQSVGKGQTIGLCGSTGKSTGPHVHFEVKLNGVRRNPMIYLK